MNPYENLYIALVKEAMEGVNTDRPFSFRLPQEWEE